MKSPEGGDGPQPAAKQGRPRDTSIGAAVLRATVELLEEIGYDRLTIPQVAARAGATPPAVYRRFPSKVELVYEAVFASSTATELPIADDLASTVRALLGRSIDQFRQRAVRTAAAGLMADLRARPGLSRRLASAQEATYRQLQEYLDEALPKRPKKKRVDAQMLADLISGMVMMAEANERDLDDAWVDAAAALIVDGLAH